jgi:hypothetical protein
MADRPKKTVDIFVDSRFSPSQRREIGEAAVRYIRERTSKGIGVGGVPFSETSDRKSKRYSERYIDSPEYKTAGKSPAPINLALTKDMLDSIEVVDVSLPGRVTIGFKEAGFESDKAWFNEEKGYNFLGVSDAEVSKLLPSVPSPDEESEPSLVRGVAERLAKRLLGK